MSGSSSASSGVDALPSVIKNRNLEWYLHIHCVILSCNITHYVILCINMLQQVIINVCNYALLRIATYYRHYYRFYPLWTWKGVISRGWCLLFLGRSLTGNNWQQYVIISIWGRVMSLTRKNASLTGLLQA
jgi:hypothetical protein